MPKINLIIPHKLRKEIALQRIKKLLTETKEAHADKITDLEETWAEDHGEFSFSAMGFGVTGTLDVRDSEVELNGKLPLLAMAFKGTIEDRIRENAENILRLEKPPSLPE